MEKKLISPLFYKLDKDKKAIPCYDFSEYAKEFDIAKRRVGLDVIEPYKVSTVFLVLDHSFGKGKPLLFETMVFPLGSSNELYCERYCTWKQAKRGHRETVKAIKEGRIPKKGVGNGRIARQG